MTTDDADVVDNTGTGPSDADEMMPEGRTRKSKASDSASTVAAAAVRLRRLLPRLENQRIVGLLISTGIAIVVFTLVNSNFLTARNSLGLVRSMSSLAIMALGLTLVIIAGELDLAVGATYGLAAMVAGTVWVSGVPLWLALLAGLGVGAAIGVVNAWLTAVVGIPSFIVTLGTLNIAQGLTLYISGAQGLNPAHSRPGVSEAELSVFRAIGATKLPFGVPIQIIWLIALALLIGFLLHRTLFGFRLLAIGGNREAARVVRLKGRKYIFLVFIASGVLSALAGILDFSFLGSTGPSAGLSLLFPVFAAVIIGGASLTGGRGSIPGTIAGAVLLAVLGNGLSILGVGSFAQLIFIGVATIGAVAMDRWTTQET